MMLRNYSLETVPESSVDEKRISHFSSQVSKWWNKNNLLLKMNQTRLPALLDGLRKAGQLNPDFAQTGKPLTGLNILDIGCGGGIFSEAIAELGVNVTGLDASEELIKCAKLHATKNNKITSNNSNYVYNTIEDFCENNFEKFDVVVVSEVVAHVTSLEYFLESAIITLKPGGSIFITTINRTTKSWLKAIIFFEYILGIVPKGTHNWYKLVTPEELENALENNNCKKILQGAWRYKYFSSQFDFIADDLSVYYYMHAIKDTELE